MSKTVPSPSSASSSSDSSLLKKDEVTAENAAEILAADDDADGPDAEAPRRSRPSRRTLLTVGGLATSAPLRSTPRTTRDSSTTRV